MFSFLLTSFPLAGRTKKLSGPHMDPGLLAGAALWISVICRFEDLNEF